MEDKEKAFRDLITQNREMIYRICIYHSSSQEDCDDLFQQVLINIWQSLKNFRGESKISTWIYRIALNTSIDFIRAENRRIQQKFQIQQEYARQFNSDDRWEKLRNEKLLGELASKINTLSVIDKLIMSLMLEEVSMREIADIVGVSEGNVRVKIHRIKESLKLTMGGLYDE